MTVPRISRGSRQFGRSPTPLAAPVAGADGVASVGPKTSLFTGIHWTVAFLAFAAYVYSITSYRVHIGTEAMTVALLALPLERNGLRFTGPMLWMVAFLGWAALGWATTIYPDVVWDQTIELAKIAAVMLVAANVVTTRARFRLYVVFTLAICALYPVRGTLINYFLVGERLMGRAVWNHIYGNPNDLAAYCLLQISLTVALLATERTRWVRLSAALGAAILGLIILLTQSRGAFVGLAFFGLIAFRERLRQLKRLVVPVIVSMIVLMFVPDSAWKRFGTISRASDTQSIASEDQGSADSRRQIWQVAVSVIGENPLTGVGLGAYQEAHYEMARRSAVGPMARGHRDAHSTYLRLFAETGAIGFLCFAGLITSVLVSAERQRRRSRSTHPQLALQLGYLELGLVAFLIAGIWGSYGLLVFLYLHLILIHVATRL